MSRLAIFASGTGSNFVALEQAVREGRLNASIELVVCDKQGAPVIEKAKQAGLETLVLSPKAFPSKAFYEKEILSALKAREVEWLVLAGYMRLIGPTLLESYPSHIVNIHPSLLPDFPGLNVIEKAYEAGAEKTGVTVHLVDEGMDTGPILAQEVVPIYPNESLEALEARIHTVEHQLYPKTLQELFSTVK